MDKEIFNELRNRKTIDYIDLIERMYNAVDDYVCVKHCPYINDDDIDKYCFDCKYLSLKSDREKLKTKFENIIKEK